MDCSFGSPACAVVIRFRSLFERENLNLERLPKKSGSVGKTKRRHSGFQHIRGRVGAGVVEGFWAPGGIGARGKLHPRS